MQFILLIIFGYIAGTPEVRTHKFNYVLVVYLLNLIVVSANVEVYFINRRYDKQAEKASSSFGKRNFRKTQTILFQQKQLCASAQKEFNQGDDETDISRELNSVTEAGGVLSVPIPLQIYR